MHSTEIDEFLFAHNSDIPKRLDIYLLKGVQVKAHAQLTLDMLNNVSIKAWDDRGILVNYHTSNVPDVFVSWSAVNYILEHK